MSLSGTPLDYIIAFLGGILASFTPCVYPFIPITVGYIGVNSEGFKLKGFFLSLTFVTGLAITYSILGLIASLTGSIFGMISSHPVTNIFVGFVIIVFGISMLDLFHISLPVFKQGAQKKGYLGVFLLGLTSGFIVSPCLTPILGSILFFIATKQKIFYGITLLLCFAYGMGLIFILAGSFSSFLVNLPKSGRWTVYLKRTIALILIIIGIYFLLKGAIDI